MLMVDIEGFNKTFRELGSCTFLAISDAEDVDFWGDPNRSFDIEDYEVIGVVE